MWTVWELSTERNKEFQVYESGPDSVSAQVEGETRGGGEGRGEEGGSGRWERVMYWLVQVDGRGGGGG